MGRDPAEELAQAQYSQIANRLDDPAAELLASAAYQRASPARTIAMSCVHGRSDKNPATLL